MSQIKNKDRILEAIDQLRRRKARPDIDRICNFLLRRFSVNNKETKEDLSRMVEAEIVIKVEYKGNTSYRNAAKWSRLSVYKSKESSNAENNNVSEARTSLSRAFASLLVDDPDYLDFGVPENELKRVLSEESSFTELTELDAVLQREINSGFLVKLANGNLSLADHPVPSRKISGGSISSDVKVLKFESPSSQFQTESVNIVQKSTRSTSGKDAEDTQNVGTENRTNPSADKPAAISEATGAINVGGFRVGVRRKRAKKVFDPSDNNIPTRKRGRPVGSPNKSKETAPNVNIKPEPSDYASTLCSQGNQRLVHCEKSNSGQNCDDKINPSCTDVVHAEGCECVSCRLCALCCQPVVLRPNVSCSACKEYYHNSCHPSEILSESSPVDEWLCFRCEPTEKPKPESPDEDSNNMGVVDIDRVPSPSPASSVPESTVACYPVGVECEPADTAPLIDESIPDVRGWTDKEIFIYLEEQGCSDQAVVFLNMGVDGDALLMMRRQDVLNRMGLKLGPALKVYRHVQRLQLRRSEPYLFWA